jgi:predicted short-subunit dehydrogenase-like oxidoreductase (DUF2520 family)
MATIGIIGTGKVATTLGALLARSGFRITGIYGRAPERADAARKAIGAGVSVSTLHELEAPDLLLVAVSDRALDEVAGSLAAANVVEPGSVVFHTSGAVPSSVFALLRASGATIGSVHPVKSFTAPERDVESFAGTWCGIEGDAEAVARLEAVVTAIGGRPFRIDPARKPLYHLGAVFCCNYLPVLVEAGLASFAAAGVDRETAMQAVGPILRETVDNILRLGPAAALTGPISRGDGLVVRDHLAALRGLGPALERLYRAAGVLAVPLAGAKGQADEAGLAAIRAILEDRG